MDTRTEETLWALARDSDGEAFGVLFDRHHPRVYRHASRLIASSGDAEDVTASTFLEAWRRRDDLTLVNGSLLPWLLVTTTNLARNSHRSTRRYRDFLNRLPRETTVPDTAETALSGPLGLRGHLSEALATLPPHDLQLITLVVFEDLTLADAATALGLSASAAKTRLHRARIRLRASLADNPSAAHFLPVHEGQRP